MAIRIFRFGARQAEPIALFGSLNASSVSFAHGRGDTHAHAVHFAPGGVIGPHPAGFDQLFLVVHGSGWIAGADGIRHQLNTLEGGFVPLGETHSKGSQDGMVAIMLQASHYELGPSEPAGMADHRIEDISTEG